MGWGDTSVYTMLGMQAQGAEFNVQHTHKNLGVAVPACNPKQRPEDPWGLLASKFS